MKANVKHNLQTVQPRSGVLLRLVIAAMVWAFRNYVSAKNQPTLPINIAIANVRNNFA